MRLGDWGIEVVSTREQLVELAALATALAPERPYTADELEHAERAYPGSVRLLVRSGDAAIGYGTVGRIYVFAPDFDGAWAEIGVVDDHRRQRHRQRAVPSACPGTLRRSGRRRCTSPPASRGPTGSPGWSAAAFAEYERSRAVALDVPSAEVRPVDAPAGIEITTLAERPDLLRALHAVADATAHDIPGQDEPHTAGTFEEWVAYDIEGPHTRRDAIFIALAGDEIAGYASLGFPGAYPTVAWHDMTGVMPAYRGRGIAGALKRAAVAWAAANGIVTLETENNVENAPMRAINLALGYQPQPDQVIMRGPLSSE